MDVSPDYLSGYDELFAISKKSINASFKYEHARGAIRSKFGHRSTGFTNAKIGPPTIDFWRGDTPDASRVFLSLPFTQGVFTVAKDGKSLETNLRGLVVSFEVTLNNELFASPNDQRLDSKASSVIAANIAKQGGSWSPGATQVSRITIKFNPDMIQWSLYVPNANTVPVTAGTLEPFKTACKAYVNEAFALPGALGMNPFALGYSIQQKANIDPIWAPTSVRYGIHRSIDSNSDYDALMFLLRTNNRTPPTSPQAGLFKFNPVTTLSAQCTGVFMFSNHTFFEDWIKSVCDTIKPRLRNTGQEDVFVRKSQRAWYYAHWEPYKKVYDRPTIFKLDIHVEGATTNTCEVTVNQIDNDQIEIVFQIVCTRPVVFFTKPGTGRQDLGYQTTEYRDFNAFILSANGSGGINVVHYSLPAKLKVPQPYTEAKGTGKSFWQQTNGIDPKIYTTDDMGKYTERIKSQLSGLSDSLQAEMAKATSGVVFPGAEEYAFSNLRITEQGHIVADIAYKFTDGPPTDFPALPETPPPEPVPQQPPVVSPTIVPPVTTPAPPITTPRSDKEYVLKTRSELLTVEELIQAVGRRERFSAVTDAAGNIAIFAISSDGRLELIQWDSSCSTKGWSIKDISPPGSMYVQEVEAFQRLDGVVFVAIACNMSAKTETGPSKVSIAELYPHNIAKADWTKIWLDRRMPANVSIGRFSWGHPDVPTAGPTLLASTIGSTNSNNGRTQFARNYVIDTASMVFRDPYVLRMPVNSTEVKDMALGITYAGARGVYTLCKTGSETKLYFTTLTTGDETIINIEVPCRNTDNCLFVVPRGDGKTHLFVGGAEGVYHYPVGGQSKPGILIAASSSFNGGVTRLQGHILRGVASLWAIDASSRLSHTTAVADSQGDVVPASWKPMLAFRNGIVNFAPTFNSKQEVDELVLLSNTGNTSLTHIWQSSKGDGSWEENVINIPSGDQTVSSETYSTVIAVLAKDGKTPSANTNVTLSTKARTFVTINGAVTQLSRIPLTVSTDYQGKITIVQPTKTLGAPVYTIEVEGTGSPTTFDPSKTAVDKIQQYKTVEDFKKAKNPDGTNVFNGTESEEDMKNAFDFVKNMSDIKSNLSTDNTPSAASTQGTTLSKASTSSSGQQTITKARPFQTSRALDTRNFGSLISSGAQVIAAEFGDLLEHAKNALNDLKEIGLQIVDGIVKFAIKIGNTIVSAVVKAWDKFCDFMSMAFEKIKEGFEWLGKWLGYLFDWNDIRHTQQSLVKVVNNILDRGVSEAERMKTGAKSTFQDLRLKIDRRFLPDSGKPPNPLVKAAADSIKATTKKIFSTVEDALSKLYDNPLMDTFNQIMKAIMDYVDISLMPDLTKYLKGAFSSIFERLGTGLENISNDIVNLVSRLVEMFGSGQDFSINTLMDALIGTFLKVGVELVETAALSALDIVGTIVQMLKDLFNHEIRIPLISKLYEAIMGEKMTFLGVAMWMAAIPTTILCKLTMGVRPFDRAKQTTLVKRSQDIRATAQMTTSQLKDGSQVAFMQDNEGRSQGNNSSKDESSTDKKNDPSTDKKNNQTDEKKNEQSTDDKDEIPWHREQWQQFVLLGATVLEEAVALAETGQLITKNKTTTIPKPLEIGTKVLKVFTDLVIFAGSLPLDLPSTKVRDGAGQDLRDGTHGRRAGVIGSFVVCSIVMIKDIFVAFNYIDLRKGTKVRFLTEGIQRTDMFLSPVMNVFAFIFDACGYGGNITIESDRKSYPRSIELYYNGDPKDVAASTNELSKVQEMAKLSWEGNIVMLSCVTVKFVGSCVALYADFAKEETVRSSPQETAIYLVSKLGGIGMGNYGNALFVAGAGILLEVAKQTSK